jgi:hypothetical protein
MAKTLHIGTSPLTNTIYCGSVSKDGKGWLSNKSACTAEACAAVAYHVLAQKDQTVIVTGGGRPLFEITVKRLGEDPK